MESTLQSSGALTPSIIGAPVAQTEAGNWVTTGSQNAPSRVQDLPHNTSPPTYPQDIGSSLLPLSEGEVQETR